MSENVCHYCKCQWYPDCMENEEESCENCIDGAGGFHKKIDHNGIGVADIPEDYEMCPNCKDYYANEELHDHKCHLS